MTFQNRILSVRLFVYHCTESHCNNNLAHKTIIIRHTYDRPRRLGCDKHGSLSLAALSQCRLLILHDTHVARCTGDVTTLDGVNTAGLIATHHTRKAASFAPIHVVRSLYCCATVLACYLSLWRHAYLLLTCSSVGRVGQYPGQLAFSGMPLRVVCRFKLTVRDRLNGRFSRFSI